jgi:hypothetical protein
VVFIVAGLINLREITKEIISKGAPVKGRPIYKRTIFLLQMNDYCGVKAMYSAGTKIVQ